MIFDKFKGISKEREIEARGKNNLEQMINLADKIIEKYTYENIEPNDKCRRKVQIYHKILNELGNSLTFDESGLRDFIHAKTNNNYAPQEAEILGLYSGCLLEILTEKNRQLNKGTKFYINGQNGRFDYLFNLAKHVDELIVENFQGNEICYGLGSYWGHVNSAVCKNIKGNFILANCAYVGTADILIGQDINGECALGGISNGTSDNFKTKVGLIIGQNITGNETLASVGNEGEADMIIGRDIKGKETLYGVGGLSPHQHKVKMIFLQNIFDSETLVKSHAHTVIVKNMVSDLAFAEAHCDIIYHADIQGKNLGSYLTAEQIIPIKKNPAKYNEIMKQFRINEILELVDIIKIKNGKDLFDVVTKIKQEYAKIENKAQNDI